MPRKTDANQKEIMTFLRAAGCTVQSLHTVGRGVPDLLVGFRGVNYLLEVKDGTKVLSRQKLTTDEEEWHERWRGQVTVVASRQEAAAAVGLNVQGL